MNWTTHYFDRRLNRDSVSRAFASKEDALRQACDLMRQNCVVRFVKGPNDEKIDAVAITAWCKGRPTRKDPPPPKYQPTLRRRMFLCGCTRRYRTPGGRCQRAWPLSHHGV